MNFIDRLKKHEGFRNKPYQDTEGVWTLGYGFNLEATELPKTVSELWLVIEIEKKQDKLKEFYWYNRLDPIRQDAILNMAYNIGVGGLLGFKKMIKALENQKYKEAAKEALDSKWATQVGQRAKDIAFVLEHGHWSDD